MDILNNREIAIALWLVVISAYFIFSKKMVEVRKAFKDVIRSIFVGKIIFFLSLITAYMSAAIYFLSEHDLWNTEQLKNTFFWFFSVAFASLFKIETIKNDKKFFKHAVIDNLKIVAIIQFVVGVYTFPLWLEIMVVPIFVLISVMLAVAETEKNHHRVRKLLNYSLSVFGGILIIYTSYMLIMNFATFGNEKTAYDFLVPPLLTLCYLPFVFALLVYSTYEQVFLRLQFSIKSALYRNLAKLYALVLFNFRLGLLERWSYQVARKNIESHNDLIKSFMHLFKVRASEQQPKAVSIELGWSPYKAKDYLTDDGLRTGFYNRQYEDFWCALSPMLEIGDGLIPSNIAYYVEGKEDIAKTLKIKVNVNDASKSQVAREELLRVATNLSMASLNRCLSQPMQSAILHGEGCCETFGNKEFSFKMERWPAHKLKGHDFKFIISTV